MKPGPRDLLKGAESCRVSIIDRFDRRLFSSALSLPLVSKGPPSLARAIVCSGQKPIAIQGQRAQLSSTFHHHLET